MKYDDVPNYNFNQFVREYTEFGENTWLGMDFYYKSQWYRFCREPNAEYKYYLYSVKKIDPKGTDYVYNLDYKTLGVYDALNDLLSSRDIDNQPFKEVLFSNDTEIFSQD